MWLLSRSQRILSHPGPVVLLGPEELGASRLIAALDDAPRVWLTLSPDDAQDPVAQGNKLADATKRALGEPLFGYALPYAYGLNLLRTHLPLLAPLTLALSGAQHGLDMAGELLELQREGSRVVLHFDALPEGFTLPEGTLVLAPDELHLTEAEALELVEGRLPEEEEVALLKESGYAYEPYLTALHHRLQLDPPERPHSDGARLPPSEARAAEPAAVLRVLVSQEKWLKALEVAVHYLPERTPEVLAEAGHHYHERGMHLRLARLLEGLPDTLRGDEEVLYWRFTAAIRLGEAETLRREVEAHLSEHEAPELRALYAGVLARPDELLPLAERAYRAKVTPFTAFQYGRALYGEPRRSLEVLHASVELAERAGRPYEVARNAGLYTSRLIHAGRYRDAAHWGTWALREFDRLGLSDAQRRLLLVNNLAYARLLTGEGAGLLRELEETEAQLGTVLPEFAFLFRSTLGDCLLAQRDPVGALRYYRTNHEGAPRVRVGEAASNLVRALLEVGETRAALHEAERARSLTAREHPIYRDPALLAHGMALSVADPREAVALLETFIDKSPPAHRFAQASLYLTKCLLALDDEAKARHVLKKAQASLEELSPTGFRLLAGPEAAFAGVRALLYGQDASLELRLLGQPEVRLNGVEVPLTLRQHEILALLALHPQGLSLERLLLLVYGDDPNRRSLISALNKLRKHLPVSHEPYRLELPFRCDYKEALAHLKAGAARAALALYRGPLLVPSDVPGIVEAREHLDEALRQAALAAGDVEVCLAVAELHGDDLELWEAAQRALSKGDPRAPVVRARVKQVTAAWGY